MKVKFEVIRNECDGVVDGYKLGEWYLWKRYYWNNSYSWIVTKRQSGTVISNYIICDLIEAGEVIPVRSCKDGKELLVKMNENGGM